MLPRRRWARALLLVCSLIAATHVGQQPAAAEQQLGAQKFDAIEFWRGRLLEDRAGIDFAKAEVVERMVLLEGQVLLGEIKDPLRFAREYAQPDLEEGMLLLIMAGVHAKLNQLDAALSIVDRIEHPVLKPSALSSVAHMRLHRGDFAGALKLADRLDARRRDSLLDSIVGKHLENFDAAAARETLALIKNIGPRNTLVAQVERAGRRPQLGDPDFVNKFVAWTEETARARQAEAAELRELLGQEAPKSPKAEHLRAMYTQSASALDAHHRGDQTASLHHLRSLRNLVQEIDDENIRMAELLSTACTTHVCEQRELTREILLDVTADPQSDDYYLAMSLWGQKPMDAVAGALNDEEIAVLVKRWRSSELPTEVFALATALADRGEYQRMDAVCRLLEKKVDRLMVYNIALERLQQRN